MARSPFNDDDYDLAGCFRIRPASLRGDSDEQVNTRPMHKRTRLNPRPQPSIFLMDEEEVEEVKQEESGQSEEEEEEEEEEEVGGESEEEVGGESEEERDDNDHIKDEEQDGSHSHVVITLTDPEVFDCPICFESLTIPVYQCDQNGHIACSSCCTKINNKCPSCSGSVGFNRCRAIEKALESITISCQNIHYGCKASVAFHKKGEHQKACVYSPCSCPHLSCNFVSSAEQLYQHFSSSHVNSATQFRYYDSIAVSLNASDKFLVLQEKNNGTLFILKNHRVEDLGSAMTITCVQPGFMEGFFFELYAKTEKNYLILQSFTMNAPSLHLIDDSPPRTGFLLIPCGFISPGGQLKMELCIWPKGVLPI
ncbi:unnamed protein product [Prunus armeniaca]|uniref:RING-type E3 ubiquitin transferase n=1 Tax=Prunus armeniaca TaxID=36596 RepID=A0A6J5Y4A7_PRUAR|nr:unnamed protein product [Prunus armeniaca]